MPTQALPDESPVIRVIFVDLENIPTMPKGFTPHPGTHFVLICGAKQTRVDLPMVAALVDSAASMQFIRLTTSGRNALDFALCFHLGASIAKHSGARFHILSKDKDFDPLVKHVLEQGICIERNDAYADIPHILREVPVDGEIRELVERSVSILRKYGSAYPTSEKKLASMLKSQVKMSEKQVKEVISVLENRQVVTFDEERRVENFSLTFA